MVQYGAVNFSFRVSTLSAGARPPKDAHLKYCPLPGGDVAIRKPARTALAYLWLANIDWDEDIPSVKSLSTEERNVLFTQLEKQINAPLTSSIGRLFDAVASLTGLRQVVNYEAQAAIEFEAIADQMEEEHYEFSLISENGEIIIDPIPVIYSVVKDLRKKISPATISARFHNGLAVLVLDICNRLRNISGCSMVVLSGGVWQNLMLLNKTVPLLEEEGFLTIIHRVVPPNDGGIALGQAVITAKSIT